MDQAILGFLGISADQFQDAAYHHVNDIELGEGVLEHADRTLADRTLDEIAHMNAALSGKGPEGDQQIKFFNTLRDHVLSNLDKVAEVEQSLLQDVMQKIETGRCESS